MPDRPGGSVAFDRAADVYDATRALPADVQAQVMALLVAELAGRGPVLEIGVGTGRMALPLVAAGVPVVGVDLSAPMLARLRAKAAGSGAGPAPLPAVALGDATALPFASGGVAAGLVCHVLHLIPDWRAAVAELARVVRPGGVVLVDLGGDPGEEVGAIQARFMAEAGLARRHPGVDNDADTALVTSAFAEHGGRLRELAPIPVSRSVPLGLVIDLWEGNSFSWTWPLDDATRHRAAAATREWAAGRFGDLGRPRPGRATIRWRAYDL
jgi:SAM-dependent methyltransferase